jgi:hypothetical protein
MTEHRYSENPNEDAANNEKKKDKKIKRPMLLMGFYSYT